MMIIIINESIYEQQLKELNEKTEKVDKYEEEENKKTFLQKQNNEDTIIMHKKKFFITDTEINSVTDNDEMTDKDLEVKHDLKLNTFNAYDAKHTKNVENIFKFKNYKANAKYKVNIVKRREKICSKLKRNKESTKWRWKSSVLATLMILNITERGLAAEVLSTSSLAYILGYPASCTLEGQVHECALSLSCWLSGGTRHPGCGGWLFTCCQSTENSMSADWSYQVSPPRLKTVPHRSAMPNNVFRRRVDDDVPQQLECGLSSSMILQKRIIGGREAQPAEFPWQAHVRISEFQCGGVLVSQWFVATAAHCVSRAHIRDIVVWLGALDTSVGSHTARKIGVHRKILHPLFQFRMTQPDRYDIALLQLARPAPLSRHIRAICLPEPALRLRGRSALVAGWGKTDATHTHTGTNVLRSATVPILSKEQCIAWHQSKQISVEIHPEMICAGHPDGHQDACLGDSGGPLIVLEEGRYYLVGITSAGFGCGVDHQPGIYHLVQTTVPWIRAVIQHNERSSPSSSLFDPSATARYKTR